MIIQILIFASYDTKVKTKYIIGGDHNAGV